MMMYYFVFVCLFAHAVSYNANGKLRRQAPRFVRTSAPACRNLFGVDGLRGTTVVEQDNTDDDRENYCNTFSLFYKPSYLIETKDQIAPDLMPINGRTQANCESCHQFEFNELGKCRWFPHSKECHYDKKPQYRSCTMPSPNAGYDNWSGVTQKEKICKSCCAAVAGFTEGCEYDAKTETCVHGKPIVSSRTCAKLTPDFCEASDLSKLDCKSIKYKTEDQKKACRLALMVGVNTGKQNGKDVKCKLSSDVAKDLKLTMEEFGFEKDDAEEIEALKTALVDYPKCVFSDGDVAAAGAASGKTTTTKKKAALLL